MTLRSVRLLLTWKTNAKLITISHNAGTGIGGLVTGFTVASGVVIGYYA